MNTILLVLALLLPLAESPKKCTGQTPCPACTSCSRCRHCKVEGGTCGACQHPDNQVIRVIDGDTIGFRGHRVPGVTGSGVNGFRGQALFSVFEVSRIRLIISMS